MGDFDRSPKPDFPYPKDIHVTTMTQYNVKYPFPVAFPPQKMDDVLAEWLAKQGVKQCHVAETEKYAHVTFFFNCLVTDTIVGSICTTFTQTDGMCWCLGGWTMQRRT